MAYTSGDTEKAQYAAKLKLRRKAKAMKKKEEKVEKLIIKNAK